MEYAQLQPQAAEALARCLREVTFVYGQEIEQLPAGRDDAPDLLARLKLPAGEQLLLVEVKGSGQPRLVREAINQLLRLKADWPGAYPVVVAPYLTPQAAELCEREGVGCIDLAGNCRLAFGQVYIRREGCPNPVPARRDLRSLYSPKAERVLRALLADPSRRWKMQPLAGEAQVSLGQAANVKKLLADREWIRSGPEGFSLAEPEALLSEWAENYARRRRPAEDYYTLESVEGIERGVAAACAQQGLRCALTGFSAAARLAPAVRYQRATVYVAGDLEQLAARLELKKVASGPNLRLLVPYDDGVFYGCRDQDGLPVVSPVQAYLDLAGLAGRGEEAAAALLQELIRPQWRPRE